MGHHTSRYLERHQLYPFQIAAEPSPDLGLVVVIPCCDEPDLVGTLDSLAACRPVQCEVEVLVVINGSEASDDSVHRRNRSTTEAFDQWRDQWSTPGLRFFRLDYPRLPARHAGVGLARKLGMDEAAGRLQQSGGDGVLVCLDADCRVEPSYLAAIERYFAQHPKVPAASIYYEHPLEGHPNSDAIVLYELHLRYYARALRFAGFPHAHQTVGSCMAVRVEDYCRQGGMNRRKAGEDFYFLQKFAETLGSITETCVQPSPRVSLRVPFGTGKAMADARRLAQQSYDPRIFDDLQPLLGGLARWYAATPQDRQLTAGLADWLQSFLRHQGFRQGLAEIQANTSGPASFGKRFLRWFNAFRALKCVHYATERVYHRVPVEDAARGMLRRLNADRQLVRAGARELLAAYREMDRSA